MLYSSDLQGTQVPQLQLQNSLWEVRLTSEPLALHMYRYSNHFKKTKQNVYAI